MMARNYNNMHDYGTSPRKLQPEYIPQKRSKNNKVNYKSKPKEIKKDENKLRDKKRKIQQRKTVIYITLGFFILFAISYRNTEIDESFSQVQKLQGELATIEKENEQLKVNIENGSNLNNLEQAAKELLGMQKLNNKQSIYVSLPKVDYIKGNQTKEDKGESIFERITKNVLNIF